MKIVAHRGESYAAPENTMPAFELAWQRGSKWIELDVHLSSDGVVVVHHDDDTGRTGDKKLLIAGSAFEQLRQVDLGIKKARRWKNTRMSNLTEVITAMPRRKGYGMLIEIKAHVKPSIVSAVKKVLNTSGRQSNQFVLMSFDGKLISNAKHLMPETEARLLVVNRRDSFGNLKPTQKQIVARIKRLGLDSIGPAWSMLDEKFMGLLKAEGIAVNPWTTDKPSEAKKLISLGVDSITSNRPKWLRKMLQL